MSRIATYKRTREILALNGLMAKKALGQNFLVDPHVITRIIPGSELTKDDFVIEIGPGIGGLTEYLCEASGFVTAIEIDSRLIPVLEDNLSSYDNIRFINADVLKNDLQSIIRESGYKKAKIVANLPYYITTPIIMGILENPGNVTSLTVMVQKEVARRMAAGPGTKDYGALSLAVAYAAKPEIIAHVPVNCCIPRPNVDSAVIRLNILDKPAVNAKRPGHMFALIKAAFATRRKTLLNCLFAMEDNALSKAEIALWLKDAGLSEDVRGETLSLEQFARLSDTAAV
jgi:16S rRNA (adenine1518-N6/adenine1519-N6)-dimethyltransferase